MTKPSVLLIALVSLSLCGSSFAFLDFFKGDLDKVPESAEIRAQDAAAKLKLTEAMEFESAGRADKAFDIYKGIVKKYPITTSAAMSQYKMGSIQKSKGDYVKAFDSFQTFIDDYKQSSAFNAAIASQFEIAKASQTGEHKEKFIGISRKVQRSEVLKMYQSVIDNAPYSEYAPQSQYAMGEVLEKNGNYPEATAAYKKVVADYPKTKLAADAQYRIGELGAQAIEDGSRNIANVDSSRRAYEDLLIGYENDSRREEAKSRVVEFNELEAQKAYEVGRFYEKQKKYRSAALYYRRVSQSTGTSASAKATERLAIIEGKISDQPPTAAAKPERARLRDAIPRPKLGSRLFGRKKRAEREAEEAAALAAVENRPPASKPATVTPRKPIASGGGGATVASASAVPAAPRASKRKGYYGPPKPSLGLGKKKNNMRMDTSKLQNIPFELGSLDKKDLEKGLKKISELAPGKVPAEIPDDLSDLVIPPDIDEENAVGALEEAMTEENVEKLKKKVEELKDAEDSLKIPPVPEEE